MSVTVSDSIQCRKLACLDIDQGGYYVADLPVDTDKIFVVMIAEAPPADPGEHFYVNNSALYFRTTALAFEGAGISVASMRDILDLGIYVTTAVKCAKTGYSLATATVKECSLLLEKELALFPHIKAMLLMGDVAIKALNTIARGTLGKRVIPAGSTYKIRNSNYFYNGIRVIPSYLMTGKNFLIEKTKRSMVAEDIRSISNLLR